MNIVILSGSPRKDANTDRLAAAFVRGAESSGNSVTLFRTADMSISGCTGCAYCIENPGTCVQEDDMTKILNALKKADALVLASPVYYWSVTAQLKLAIDRTYALLRAKTPIKQAGSAAARKQQRGLLYRGLCPEQSICAVNREL